MRTLGCSRLFLLALLLVVVPASLTAQVIISVGFPPPALPVYAQPPCPEAGYLWTPGYWAYGPYGYYWVPGTWVLAPVAGYLWTPGYWGWGGNAYIWHAGYWGPQVGYYGGINYGYGYNGYGYSGGYWRDRRFYYNRSVNNVNVVNIHNVYNTTVVNRVNVERVSYNGGRGGVTARPTAAQEAAMREQHVAATNTQLEHQQAAGRDRSLQATVNHGRPPIAATAKPTAFHGPGVVAARNAPTNLTAAPHGNARTNETSVPHPVGVPNANVAHPENRAAPESRANTYHGSAPTYPGNHAETHPAPPVETPRTETPHEVQHPPVHVNPGQAAPYGAESQHPSPHAYQNEPREPRTEATPAPHVQSAPHEATPHESAPHTAPEHGAPKH